MAWDDKQAVHRELTLGAEGRDVRQVQVRLNDVLERRVAADGIYGKRSKFAAQAALYRLGKPNVPDWQEIDLSPFTQRFQNLIRQPEERPNDWKKIAQRRRERRQRADGQFDPDMLGGCPNTLSEPMKLVVVRAVDGHGLVITATSNGGHTTGSYHFYDPCRAIDTAGAWDDMVDFQRDEASRGASDYRELFGPDGFYIKNGVRYAGHFPGHGDHDHVALDF